MTLPADKKSQILEEIAQVDAATKLLKEKTRQLQTAVRSAAKTRFYGIDRRQLIERGQAMTVDEFAATTGRFRDMSGNRKCREKLEERGVWIDPDFDLVLTDDFLDRTREMMERCRALENA